MGIYPKDTPTIPTYTCTWLFMTALLVPVKYWKLPKRPKQGNWLHSCYGTYNQGVPCKEERGISLWTEAISKKTLSYKHFFKELPVGPVTTLCAPNAEGLSSTLDKVDSAWHNENPEWPDK